MDENNVLGTRRYGTNIDFGLAERVNAEVAEEIRRKQAAEARKNMVKAKQPTKPDAKTGFKPITPVKPVFSVLTHGYLSFLLVLFLFLLLWQ